MPTIWRVRDRATFAELRRSGRRSRCGPVTVTWLPGAAAGEPPRLAFAIGTHVGSAVLRNRIRRRIRSIVAEAAPSIPPGAYLVGAGSGAADLTYGDLRTNVLTAIAALPDRDAASGPSGPGPADGPAAR